MHIKYSIANHSFEVNLIVMHYQLLSNHFLSVYDPNAESETGRNKLET